MPEPLPLTELLETLKAAGLPIGLREHLAVGRLLSRWDDTDIASLRVALAALLARNPDEVTLVRTSFDALYGTPELEARQAERPSGERTEPGRPRRPPIPRRWIAGGITAVLAVALVATALLWPRPAKDSGHQPLPTDDRTVPQDAPPPPVIPDTYPRPAWGRSFAVAGGAAALLFLWLYGTRLGREAQRRARRRWSEEADALPGPHGYDLDLGDLAPPFSTAVLDDVATLLGRHASDPPRRGELDVDRTLERTVRAGLAPLVVFRSRASQHPLIVLEDVGGEMRPWRRTVRAFLAGLETRGVALDRWRFDGDAGRIFRSPGEPLLSLKQLFRLRPESPLLVIGTGAGLSEGTWIETLSGWRYRAWLQPVTDPSYWRPALRNLPLQVWPMTPEGLLAAARQLAHGELGRPVRESARAFSDRPVTALDIERLRWLVSLAPRRDPDLAEQLRQRFCPHVPPAALLDALEMPAPANPLQIGPSAADVHAFLLELLNRSRPKPGTAAHERWRLDHALQELRIPGRERGAVHELAALAQSPLAGDVETAMNGLSGVAAPFQRQVLRRIHFRAATERGGGSRATRRRRWPDAVETGVAVACLAIIGTTLPRLLKQDEPVKLEQEYSLTALQNGKLMTPAVIRDGPLDLVADDGVVKTFATGINPAPVVQAEEGWYYLRQQKPSEEGVLKVSNRVWSPREPVPDQTPTFQSRPPSLTEPESGSAPSIISLSPAKGKTGESLRVRFRGTNLDPDATVTISGDGVKVAAGGYDIARRGSYLNRFVSIDSYATPGARDVTVTNPDRRSARLRSGFIVVRKETDFSSMPGMIDIQDFPQGVPHEHLLVNGVPWDGENYITAQPFKFIYLVIDDEKCHFEYSVYIKPDDLKHVSVTCAAPMRRGDLIRRGLPNVDPPEPLDLPKYSYPVAAHGSGKKARVRIAVLIDENGKVIDAVVRDSDKTGMGFNEVALEAARKVLYQPATRDGIAGKMWAEVIFEFSE